MLGLAFLHPALLWGLALGGIPILLHLLQHSTLKKADPLRGRFRSFLLGALVRFLADEYDRRRAQKRLGERAAEGATIVPGEKVNPSFFADALR